MRTYKDGDEYAKVLIDNIREINVLTSLNPDEKAMEPEVLDILEDLIYDACNESYKSYLLDERDTILLSDGELRELFIEATRLHTNQIVSDMFMDGYLTMAVGEDGEMRYALSEKGKRAAKRYEEGYDD